MPITIGTNITSLRTQRQLGKTTDQLTAVYERLASGQRINRASDDAAGLAVSSALQVNARLFGRAAQNVNDAVSALSVAESALDAQTQVVIRVKELATQSANGVFSSTQRLALDNETQALINEFARIGRTTTFNGMNLLDGSTSTVQIQVGTQGAHTQAIELLSSTALGAAQSQSTEVPYAVNGISLQQVQSHPAGTYTVNDIVELQNGTLVAVGGNPNILYSQDGGANWNTATIPAYGGGTGLYKVKELQDGTLIASGTKSANSKLILRSTDGGINWSEINMGIVGYDNLDILEQLSDGSIITGGYARSTGTGTALYRSTDNGLNWTKLDTSTFGTASLFDITEISDGTLIGVGNTNTGTAGVIMRSTDKGISWTSITTPSSDYILLRSVLELTDGSIVALGGNNTQNGISTLRSTDGGLSWTQSTFASPAGTSRVAMDPMTNYLFMVANHGGGGVLYRSADNGATWQNVAGINTTEQLNGLIVTSAGKLITAGANAGNQAHGIMSGLVGDVTTVSVSALNVRTRTAALEALTTADAAINTLLDARGKIGAFQSRLASTFNTSMLNRNNYLAAAARITDADFAIETSRLVGSQIRQQAASSVLAQANQQPALALRLLGGG